MAVEAHEDNHPGAAESLLAHLTLRASTVRRIHPRNDCLNI